MKIKKLFTLAGGLLMAATAMAQTQSVDVDLSKYPDYRGGNFNPDAAAMQFIQRYQHAKSNGRRGAAATGRPDHLHNGTTKYFAPVFNQSSGSCGAASRIGYMFTHEQNAYRDLDGSKPENYYPTHFVFLLTYGNSGKDEFVTNVGIPSAKTYGGQTYSNLFGYNEWDDEDYGWMTGYEKWFEAFHNRCYRPTSNPYSLGTEEGREFAKNWLWNHCGDTSFKAGGLIGLGVASGGQWLNIPKTAANDEAGVTGMYYVKKWGTSVDHALTLVGYDDRIEFDLDGNGKYGEEDKDEKGAWIICNSWGQWCNGGFIYCPYAYAGATFNSDGTFNKNSWWYGELYNVRKDYRPFRTIKLKMDYTHRSELFLQAGVSTDLNAKSPETLIAMDHFKYAGDGHSGNTDPAPAVPMLGKWADGKMHDEPMEFGYDLTDLSAGYDRNQPLKYFFVITRKKSTNKGTGHIYEASIMDYEHDLEGIETPFDLGETGTYEIKTTGKTTTISCIVYGAGYNAPTGLGYSDGAISWAAPERSGHTIDSYNIYKDGEKVDNVKTTSWTLKDEAAAIYSVATLYTDGNESKQVSVATPIQKAAKDEAYEFAEAGFTIPGIFDGSYENCTIEYWIRPTKFANWNNAVGPGWGTWLQHCDNNGTYYAGWESNQRVVSSTALKKNAWNHVAIVVKGKTLNLYINGTSAGSVSSSTHSGLGGFGDLVFSSSSGNNYWQDAAYDEIRIWNVARTATQIKYYYAASGKNVPEMYGEMLPEGLLAYYKGDSFQGEDGQWYMRDCVGGHHAKVSTPDSRSQETNVVTTVAPSNMTKTTTGLSIVAPTEIYAGRPATFSAKRGDYINKLRWTAPEASSAAEPTFIFDKAGEYDVTAVGTSYAGVDTVFTKTVTVLDAPAIDATFALSSANVAAGDRVSFRPANFVPGCSYTWSCPGAVQETIHSTAGAATYEKCGTYTITLTVTDAAGQKVESSQDVVVEQVAPQPDFSVTEGVVLKGTPIEVVDHSKFAPKGWMWQFTGTAGNIIYNGQKPEIVPEDPGVFDIALTVNNEAGRNTIRRESSVIVVNADSKNGLSYGSGASVTTKNVPLPAGQTKFTIEWWMNPAKLASYTNGIGANDASFQIKVSGTGELIVSNKSKSCTAAQGTVIPGQWHHYAVAVNGTNVTIYRDGKAVSKSGTITSGLADLATFSLGTSAAGWTGSIDEFRIWNRNLTLDEIKAVCNQPLNVADLASHAETLKAEDLVLYYDFNQSGGNVQDRAQQQNDGVRSGFGPDGDAWGLSKGVFSLNFNPAAAAKDVTSLLSNTKRSFQKTTKKVNETTPSRFYEIRSWTIENATVEDVEVATKDAAGNEITKTMTITTGVHVDTQKSNDFTCTTGWDSFSRTLTNHKAFQVVDLEPGIYELSVEFGQHAPGAGDIYLVAAAGEEMPNSEDLETAALNYARLSDGSMTFVVPEDTKVALGVLVGSMTGANIFTIQKFVLTKAPLDIRYADGIEMIELDANASTTDAIYDLSGRRITAPQQGQLLIKQGQKYIVK